jgi:hypothetical protein
LQQPFWVFGYQVEFCGGVACMLSKFGDDEIRRNIFDKTGDALGEQVDYQGCRANNSAENINLRMGLDSLIDHK